jgi:RasGEF domain
VRVAWTRLNKEETSPNVLALINRFNLITHWVATEVVSETDASKRKYMLQRFIELAHALRTIQNFNSLHAVVAGLEMNPVSRLKATWKSISDKHAETYEALRLENRPNQNYATLREAIKSARPPCLPYLGTRFLLSRPRCLRVVCVRWWCCCSFCVCSAW